MKNLFDFVIKGETTTFRGKNKTLKDIKEELETLEAKYG
jgi:archaellum component FlaC